MFFFSLFIFPFSIFFLFQVLIDLINTLNSIFDCGHFTRRNYGNVIPDCNWVESYWRVLQWGGCNIYYMLDRELGLGNSKMNTHSELVDMAMVASVMSDSDLRERMSQKGRYREWRRVREYTKNNEPSWEEIYLTLYRTHTTHNVISYQGRLFLFFSFIPLYFLHFLSLSFARRYNIFLSTDGIFASAAR